MVGEGQKKTGTRVWQGKRRPKVGLEQSMGRKRDMSWKGQEKGKKEGKSRARAGTFKGRARPGKGRRKAG